VTSSAQAFADALTQLEQDRDVDAFVEKVFAPDPELHRPELAHGAVERGRDGAVRFWQQYLGQFEQIRSTFHRVVDGGPLGVLEWVGEGVLTGGAPVTYEGVSVLDVDDAGAVVRFATWYDTTPFASAVRST
jgi:hypothetical protein